MPRAYDGTVSIVQPLIAPLYGGKSMYEVMALFAGQSEATGHELVQNYWRSKHPGADFDAFWRKSLHDGWIEGTTFSRKALRRKGGAAPHLPRQIRTTAASRLISAAILRFTTDASPTMAGCKNCPSR